MTMNVTMNVTVKSEPRGVARGTFQCQMSTAGVTLTKRKQQIAVPVGSEAHYAGRNRIDVVIPDARLEIFVTKFGSYQERLAKDMTAFLSGGGNPPAISDYSLPWYFYAVSALPVGIPILTLGGALPAAFGFGLAAACFGIASKEAWPTLVRLLVIGMIVACAYLAFAALLMIAASRQA